MNDSKNLALYRAHMRHPRFYSLKWTVRADALYTRLTPEERVTAQLVDLHAHSRVKRRREVIFFVCALLILTFVIATIVTI
jgi:hypothetical protein